MATFKGKDGVVKVGSNSMAEVRGWSVEETAETIDDTVMGDDDATHLVTINRWTGSCDVLFDDTDTNGQVAATVGASISVSFQMEGDTAGDHKLSGTATVTSRSISAQHDGIVEATLQLEGNGALTEGTVSA
jgi:predicted secreted protein